MSSIGTTDEPAALLSALSGLVRVYAARATPVLRRALAELVSDTTAPTASASASAGADRRQTTPVTAPSRDHRTVRARARTTAAKRSKSKGTGGARPIDETWDTLRCQVRSRMTATGTDFAQLGQAIGRSANTVKIGLLRRTPPAPSLSNLFSAWLENGSAAPEVAGKADGFRPEPATRAGAAAA